MFNLTCSRALPPYTHLMSFWVWEPARFQGGGGALLGGAPGSRGPGLGACRAPWTGGYSEREKIRHQDNCNLPSEVFTSTFSHSSIAMGNGLPGVLWLGMRLQQVCWKCWRYLGGQKYLTAYLALKKRKSACWRSVDWQIAVSLKLTSQIDSLSSWKPQWTHSFTPLEQILSTIFHTFDGGCWYIMGTALVP